MHTIGHDDTRSSRTAIALCFSSAVGWSMTPRQLEIFLQLCNLQMADTGAHSLLPGVMDALLVLARRPWWDTGVADLLDESVPRAGRPA